MQSLEFPTFPAATQNPVMADPYKSFWQNVQGEPSRKLFVAEGHFLFLPAFAVIPVGKTNFFIGNFFDAVIADGDFTP